MRAAPRAVWMARIFPSRRGDAEAGLTRGTGFGPLLQGPAQAGGEGRVQRGAALERDQERACGRVCPVFRDGDPQVGGPGQQCGAVEGAPHTGLRPIQDARLEGTAEDGQRAGAGAARGLDRLADLHAPVGAQAQEGHDREGKWSLTLQEGRRAASDDHEIWNNELQISW